MKKVKFTKDFTHGNGNVDKKGSSKNVTSKHAAFLQKNGFAVPAGKEDKEDPEAAARLTK
jgi:hypothetical protein